MERTAADDHDSSDPVADREAPAPAASATPSVFVVSSCPDEKVAAWLVGTRVRAHAKGEAKTALVKRFADKLPHDPVLKRPRLPRGTVIEEAEPGSRGEAEVL